MLASLHLRILNSLDRILRSCARTQIQARSRHCAALPRTRRGPVLFLIISRCTRPPAACSALFHPPPPCIDYQVIYRRYASLFIIVGVDSAENGASSSPPSTTLAAPVLMCAAGLGILELIHCIVETLDSYFQNVCELDIMCVALRGSPARRVAACSVLCQQRATCSHPLLPSFRSGTTLKKRTLSSTR